MTHFIADKVQQGDIYCHKFDSRSYRVSSVEIDHNKCLIKIRWDNLSHYHTYRYGESYAGFELVSREKPISKEEQVLQKIKYLNQRFESRKGVKLRT